MQYKNFNYKKCADLEKITKSMEGDVICIVCKKRHFPDEDSFFTFYGNVTIGLHGGIIGNNLMEDGTIGRLSFICKDKKCLHDILGKYTNDILENIR